MHPLTFLVLLATPLIASAAAPAQCELSSGNRDFMQRALVEWERAARDLLDIDPRPLPWWIAFDPECTWHLEPDEDVIEEGIRVELPLTFAGEPVAVQATAHDGEIEMPNGGTIPASGGMAFTSLYANGKRPFFVMALPDTWRLDPKAAADPRLDDIILGVVSHEIVHTRQLVAVAERVEALKESYPAPEQLDDDIVEKRFGDNEAFANALEREIELFYAAARSSDRDRKAALVRQALKMAKARRLAYFHGEDAVLAPLEDLFLNMEGVATWISHELGYSTEADEGLTRSRNAWVQDEGLVLQLLIADLVPGWRERMLGPDLAAPFTLLAEAVNVEWMLPADQ